MVLNNRIFSFSRNTSWKKYLCPKTPPKSTRNFEGSYQKPTLAGWDDSRSIRVPVFLASIESWFRGDFEFGAKTMKRPPGFRRMAAACAKIHTPSSHQRTWKQRRPGRLTRTCTIHFDRRKSAPVKSKGATLSSFQLPLRDARVPYGLELVIHLAQCGLDNRNAGVARRMFFLLRHLSKLASFKNENPSCRFWDMASAPMAYDRTACACIDVVGGRVTVPRSRNFSDWWNKAQNAAFSWQLLGKFVFWSTGSQFHVNASSNALKWKRECPRGGGGGGGGEEKIHANVNAAKCEFRNGHFSSPKRKVVVASFLKG